MEEELKIRFTLKTIEDILNGNHNPFPTIICDMEKPDSLELVRKFCLFSKNMVTFKVKHFQPTIEEGLEIREREVDYGELYIEVDVN